MAKSMKTIEDMREFLLQQMQDLTDDRISVETAKGCATLVGQILSSVRLEIAYNKASGTIPKIDFVEVQEQQKKLQALEMPLSEKIKLEIEPKK